MSKNSIFNIEYNLLSSEKFTKILIPTSNDHIFIQFLDFIAPGYRLFCVVICFLSSKMFYPAKTMNSVVNQCHLHCKESHLCDE